jgi:CelD/BcsL family acetyltransferase involved in cellulose biosynthesis
MNAAPTVVHVMKARDIDPDLERRWRAIQASNRWLASPFFSPEFTSCVAQVRDDVEVAVLEQRDEPVGFFPFQRRRGNTAVPAGFGVSDFHGVIAGPDVEVDVAAVLDGCRLRSFHFDHLLTERPGFERWAQPTESPAIDLREGFEDWRAIQETVHRTGFGQLARKSRRLHRQFACVEYRRHTDDLEVLRTLRSWKSEQHRRTDVADVFAHGWARDLIELFHKADSPTFAGRLSTLWVDGDLAAAHFGIATDRVWHYWFPSYCRSFAKHSPGLLLLLEMVDDACRHGCERFDLGWGEARYKSEFSNVSVPVLAGSVGSDIGFRCRRRLGDVSAKTMAHLRRTPLAAPLRVPSRIVRTLGDRRRFA